MFSFCFENNSQNSENEELDAHERKKLKKLRAMSDSEEEEEDDEDRLREELKDLIDDNPIEDGSDSDGDNSDNSRHEKRKKRSDDEDELDDRLEDDDYDLLEENLGVKVQRRVCISIVFLGSGMSELFKLTCISFSETFQASQAYANRGQRWRAGGRCCHGTRCYCESTVRQRRCKCVGVLTIGKCVLTICSSSHLIRLLFPPPRETISGRVGDLVRHGI